MSRGSKKSDTRDPINNKGCWKKWKRGGCYVVDDVGGDWKRRRGCGEIGTWQPGIPTSGARGARGRLGERPWASGSRSPRDGASGGAASAEIRGRSKGSVRVSGHRGGCRRRRRPARAWDQRPTADSWGGDWRPDARLPFLRQFVSWKECGGMTLVRIQMWGINVSKGRRESSRAKTIVGYASDDKLTVVQMEVPVMCIHCTFYQVNDHRHGRTVREDLLSVCLMWTIMKSWWQKDSSISSL